ncbi:MAG: hypothetical protein M5R36_12165 [Deltaproteobacteria bacterium]|nr:hypothetical protein [Deltaproteobacteria bacterium]
MTNFGITENPGTKSAATTRRKKALAASLLAAASSFLEAGDEEQAADLAVRARTLDHRNEEILALCRRLADLAYRRGRAAQREGTNSALNRAYAEFNEALRRYPQHSWARRRSEETRPAGVIRRGKREIFLP